MQKKQRIDAVIFDMDGVLVDSEAEFLQRIASILSNRGYIVQPKDLSFLVGADEHLLISLINRHWPQVGWEWLRDAFVKSITLNPPNYSQLLFEDVKPFLVWLGQQGLKIGLASSSDLATVEKVLTVCQIRDYFAVVFSANHIARRKPHPDIYLKAGAELQVDLGNCLIIEDSDYGIRAGKAAGSGLVAARMDRHFGLNQTGADCIFEDLNELKSLFS